MQMAMKYKKCTNGNEIFFIQSNLYSRVYTVYYK